MRGSARRAWSALALLALASAALAAETPARLRIHGSNTVGDRLGPALVDAWLAARGHDRIERSSPAPQELTLRGRGAPGDLVVELRAHGSSTGLADLISGEADLAMSSRPVNANERQRGAALGPLDSPEQEAVLALDGVAVIVHPDSTLRMLSLDQVRSVFSGAIRNWSALGRAAGPIRVHARDSNSGTWETFRALAMGDAALRADAARYESTTQLAREVAADRDAIGFVSLAGVGTARALAIAEAGHALAPLPFSVAVEDYALSRRLYLYRAAEATALARDFVDFALSGEGQRVVEAAGFVAQEVRSWRGEVRSDAPSEYRSLVQHAERLSLNFRFGSGAHLLDGKALRDIDRLTAFMRRPENRDRALMLLGFADASESNAYQALTLSNDRVDFIARQLEQQGLRLSRLRGMGGSAPIASNDSDSGRYRNRRVEVWLAPPGTGALTAGGAR